MAKRNDRVKIEKRDTPTPELDATALDEYQIGGMDCVRFKKQVNAAGFDPRQPGQGNPSRHFDCQLLTLTIPLGFRRINRNEINNPNYTGNRFRDQLAATPGKFQPALLHVIFDLDSTPQSPLSKEVAGELSITEDHCKAVGKFSPEQYGVRTPCAKTSAIGWTGEGGQGLFVRYSWQGIYDTATNDPDPTAAALNDIFHKNEIAMAATVAPDRTVIWVPFLEGGEATVHKNGYEPKPYRDNETYELGKVIYLDKPGIWVDPTVRFTV